MCVYFIVGYKTKKLTALRLAFLQVVLPGFEPRQPDPKTVVLPLHHKTIMMPKSSDLKRCKGTNYFYTVQVFCEKKLYKRDFSFLSIDLECFCAVKLGIESLSLRIFRILQENNYPI